MRSAGPLSPGVDLCFIAARPGRARHLENPRQTPAHKYPQRYGPKSPSFARATYLEGLGDAGGTLFVSGTASIVGDDTVHAGDVRKQCAETLANIEVLIGEKNLAEHGIPSMGYDLDRLDHIKVYVRDAAHVPLVREYCAEALPGTAEIAYFNVSVCRPDLLVEIEGICA